MRGLVAHGVCQPAGSDQRGIGACLDRGLHGSNAYDQGGAQHAAAGGTAWNASDS
jgi:hypothetical protein